MMMRTVLIPTVATILALGAAPAALAQAGLTSIGPRIIDRNRIDQSPSTVAPPSGQVAGGGKRAPAAPPPGVEDQSFVLRDVAVEGATAIQADRLRRVWAGRQGQTARVRDVYAMADAIGQLYADSGYALYSVSVPSQDFRSGHVRIRVTEGYVASVTISGNTEGADLSVLKAQAARIVGERPLLQATLERNILLMNEIAGLKVGSQFEPIPGQPGAVTLKLAIKRTTFEYGIDFDNQGNALLSRTQMAANVAVNSLLREGDRTQLVVGAPLSIERYQYYGLSHTEPIGTDGAKVTVNLGDLVTNPVHHEDGGSAQFFDLSASYPLIRAVRESLTATGSFDGLNSNDALLGRTLADERTRVLRAGLSWAKQDNALDALTGVSALSVSVSEGLDAFGARQESLVYGGPRFTKLNARASRSQDLPWNFVVRAKLAIQYAFDHLPATEQFAFGGTEFGQAYDTAAVTSDSAAATSLEVAYKLPQSWFPSVLTSNEVFGFGDYARLWNREAPLMRAHDRGASAGFGVRTKLLDKLSLEAGVANAVLPPESLTRAERWRALLQVSGKF